MSKFFNNDNTFFKIMGVIWDLIELNILTLLLCIPVVSAGASFTAMHYVLWHIVRGEETYVGHQFLDAFKRNWKQATVMWAALMVIALIVVCDFQVAFSTKSRQRYVFEIIAALFALAFAAIGQYYFILLSRYENPITTQLANAAKCALAFLPRTFAMIVIVLAFALLGIRYIFYVFPLLILFGFTLPQYCCAWLYNPIFKILDA